MNANFNTNDAEHRNLIAKLSNSISDLNFYAWRFLARAGFECEPRTALLSAIKYRFEPMTKPWPPQLNQIIEQYHIIKQSTPETANAIFYSTWVFVHDFDNQFNRTQ